MRDKAHSEKRVLSRPSSFSRSSTLELARQNWATQRTPLDARIYLEAALAAKDAASVKIVAEWTAGTNLEDRTLHDMLAKAPS